MAYVSMSSRRRLKGGLGDYCTIDATTGGRVCSPNPPPAATPAPVTPAAAAPIAQACPPCNCATPKPIASARPVSSIPKTPASPSPLVHAPIIPARMPSASPMVRGFTPSQAQLMNPTQYFGKGAWSAAGKIFGKPGVTPGLPANAVKGQYYGGFGWSAQYNAWQKLSGLEGNYYRKTLGGYGMRSPFKSRGLGDVCTITANGSRICQPGATSAAAPPAASPVPQPAVPPPIPLQVPIANQQNPNAYYGAGTWESYGLIRGRAGITPGIPANAVKGQTYPATGGGVWAFDPSVKQWTLSSGVQQPAAPAAIPSVAVDSNGNPIQVGQCQGGSNPGASCLSTADCFAGGICNTGAVSSGVYSYSGSSAFPAYPSPIPGTASYGAATAAPTSSLPTWAWIAIAAGAAFVLPKLF